MAQGEQLFSDVESAIGVSGSTLPEFSVGAGRVSKTAGLKHQFDGVNDPRRGENGTGISMLNDVWRSNSVSGGVLRKKPNPLSGQ